MLVLTYANNPETPPMDDQLAKLQALLDLVDTKSNADELVKGMEMIVSYVKTFEESTTEDIKTIFAALDKFAQEIKSDSDQEQEKIKGIVGNVLGDLRVQLEQRISQKESEIDNRLSKIRDGQDGTNGKDGESIIGPPGKDGSPDTPEQVVEKINQSSTLIARSKVEGLEDAIRMASLNTGSVPVTTAFYNGLRAKNLTIVGATATQQGDTVFLTVSGSGGSGTVTSVSVVSANGFTGSVANATTTPAITIATSVTGLLKGNGTAISAAVANTDYQVPITLTTTGTSGAATFDGTTLNIPQYSGGSGGISRNVNNVSTTTAAGSTASTDYVYLCTGTFTVTLPTAVGNKNLYTIKNVGSGTITVATSSAQTIDGSSTASIPVQYTSLDLISDGSNWNVV